MTLVLAGVKDSSFDKRYKLSELMHSPPIHAFYDR
jgi:hypothetical protein